MEIKELLGVLSCLLLVLSGVTFGIKFLKKRNYLLGFEWLIVAFSGSNLLIYLFTEWKVNYSISFFLDAFSRGFGIPIVATLGLMAVTHNYKPSPLKDVMIFAASFAATFVLVLADFVREPLPYFYVLMWSCYTVYLAYFTWRLIRVGEGLHAMATAVGAAAALAVAIVYDLFPIPGDDDKMLFMIFALTTWSYTMIQLFYAYGALGRSREQGALLAAR
ncbi:hypothetical protein [Pseudomonas sp. BN102]|uniref:hypothetical protein n=1 Tax=Pseudomonas sp. BN102 TaxID=2567886 RepID=UPI0024539A3D|nr:hypothetical protein [Pseudomonas sp. BN102]MDH4608093.1 hypothetical protein [Pseudomonas sp. BN102]